MAQRPARLRNALNDGRANNYTTIIDNLPTTAFFRRKIHPHISL
jgi:hypothetical protein